MGSTVSKRLTLQDGMSGALQKISKISVLGLTAFNAFGY